MTIKEVEAILPVTRANVRFYEKEGLLFPKRNPINDYRDYSEEDVKILRKILFLRYLDISVEKIRLLQKNQLDIHTVAAQRLEELKDEEEKTENIRQILERLEKETEVNFDGLVVSYETEMREEPSLKEAARALKPFWEKLAVWGFLLLEILYTLAIYPILPDQIPTEWQGTMAVDMNSKNYLFYYIALSILGSWTIRAVLHRPLYLAWRQYLEQIRAVLSVGVTGLMLATEVYTVMSVRGTGIGCGGFLFLCGAAYLGAVLGLLLLHRRSRKKCSSENA